MRHNAEQAASAYLSGELTRRHRERFEAHLLACDDCWAEVQAARRGRVLAESARQVAPQQLRERVRATIAATPSPPRQERHPRTSVLLAVFVLAAVAVGGGVLAVVGTQQAQPDVIAAAVAGYEAGGERWAAREPTAPPPSAQLGDLRWRGSGRGVVGGLPVDAHTYQDPAGHRVVLLEAGRPFPMASGARHGPAHTWLAEVDGVVLFCADDPVPSLVVGQDRAKVLLAADRLGLAADTGRPDGVS